MLWMCPRMKIEMLILKICNTLNKQILLVTAFFQFFLKMVEYG